MANTEIKEEKPVIDSFLMIGQSNMAGRGDFGVVEPILDPNLLMLRNCRWQTMSEPINPDRGIFAGKYRSGVGLAASFALRYQKATGHRVGLIPCADGGTSVYSWQPGGPLFENALFQTRMAMKTSVLRGILWHQGEADVTKEDRRAGYEAQFMNMILSLFEGLGIAPVPVLIGELGGYLLRRGGGYEHVPELNASFRAMAEKQPWLGVVSADGLECRDDILHFNSPSLRVFGERYFEAYAAMTGLAAQN